MRSANLITCTTKVWSTSGARGASGRIRTNSPDAPRAPRNSVKFIHGLPSYSSEARWNSGFGKNVLLHKHAPSNPLWLTMGEAIHLLQDHSSRGRLVATEKKHSCERAQNTHGSRRDASDTNSHTMLVGRRSCSTVLSCLNLVHARFRHSEREQRGIERAWGAGVPRKFLHLASNQKGLGKPTWDPGLRHFFWSVRDVSVGKHQLPVMW